MARVQLRCLDYYETKNGREFLFNDNMRKANVTPLGSRVEIIWSPSHHDAVERSAPEGADTYRMIGEPRKILGRCDTAFIQYYKILN